ncbi:MAG: ABC transporter permease [Lachnospiraceae bacterium]|nr:ABC transporter permease [Lachnospiraceae bacterium]
MRVQLNPIVKKDLQVTARSMRFSWGLFAYEAVVALAFLLGLSSIQSGVDGYYGDGNIYQELINLFPVLAIAQVCIVSLIVPVMTASSISGEKERQTFDIMMTTCMSPLSIVFGKVSSAVLRVLFYVMGSLPVMALSFVVGGLSWSVLFYFVLAVIVLSVFAGSIGILCSSLCRRSISAVILTFVMYFVLNILTFCPLFVYLFGSWEEESMGECLLPLLFNPNVFFEEFFMQVMTGESILGSTGESNFIKTEVGYLTYCFTYGKVWVFLSAGCILLLAFLFMLIAAWRIDPLSAAAERKPAKKKSK